MFRAFQSHVSGGLRSFSATRGRFPPNSSTPIIHNVESAPGRQVMFFLAMSAALALGYTQFESRKRRTREVSQGLSRREGGQEDLDLDLDLEHCDFSANLAR